MGCVCNAQSLGTTDPEKLRPIRRDDFERALHKVKRPDGSEVLRHEQWNRDNGTQVYM